MTWKREAALYVPALLRGGRSLYRCMSVVGLVVRFESQALLLIRGSAYNNSGVLHVEPPLWAQTFVELAPTGSGTYSNKTQ